MKFSLLHPRDQIVATMNRIYAHDMTTTSGGNISVRDENGDIWVTPARVDKGSLRREDIVRVRPDGTTDGIHPPSSEFPFHAAVYAARPDVQSVLHAHPGALVSFSICGQVPDTRLFPAARETCGVVAFAPYALPGSRQLGERVAAVFASAAQPGCVVLENHGIVVVGGDIGEAFRRFETLEFTAQTQIAARHLGEVRMLDEGQLVAARAAACPALPEHEPHAPTSLGKEARRLVVDFVHRAYEHRLMSCAAGSFSVRTQGDTFLITPQRFDRHSLDIDDLVVVRDGARAAGRHPSRAARLHAAIYRAHPEINAVCTALPVHATAFAASATPLDTRTIPESYLFLKDVPKVPFAHTVDDGEAVAAIVGPKRHVALLENNGALVAGRSALDAFDRLEVLESTSAALIRSRVLGPLHPMPATVIDELLAAFPGV